MDWASALFLTSRSISRIRSLTCTDHIAGIRLCEFQQFTYYAVQPVDLTDDQRPYSRQSAGSLLFWRYCINPRIEVNGFLMSWRYRNKFSQCRQAVRPHNLPLKLLCLADILDHRDRADHVSLPSLSRLVLELTCSILSLRGTR